MTAQAAVHTPPAAFIENRHLPVAIGAGEPMPYERPLTL